MPDSAEEPPKDPEDLLARAANIKEAVALFGLLLLPGFSLRALIFARFDPTVATALVQFTQPLNFLLNFLLNTTPTFLFASGLAVLFWYGGRLQPAAFAHNLLIILAFLFALILTIPIFMILPFPEIPSYIFLLSFLPAAFGAGRVLAKTREKSDHELLQTATTPEEREIYLETLQARINVRLYKALIVVILAEYAFFGGMWLAPEILTIRDTPRTGYVLQEQDQDLVVYDPRLHAVLRVPKSEVTHRQFCNTENITVSQHLFGSPQGRPPCKILALPRMSATPSLLSDPARGGRRSAQLRSTPWINATAPRPAADAAGANSNTLACAANSSGSTERTGSPPNSVDT